MKTVNSIILLLYITLLSCNQKRNFESKKNVLDDATSYVNYNADSVYYKLSVGFENDDYFQDEKSNLLFLVTREIEVLGKNFGGCQKVDFSKAIDYFILNKTRWVKLFEVK